MTTVVPVRLNSKEKAISEQGWEYGSVTITRISHSRKCFEFSPYAKSGAAKNCNVQFKRINKLFQMQKHFRKIIRTQQISPCFLHQKNDNINLRQLRNHCVSAQSSLSNKVCKSRRSPFTEFHTIYPCSCSVSCVNFRPRQFPLHDWLNVA